MNDSKQQAATAEQVRLAADGLAVGQCSECGSYRADGKPPILHRDGCSHIDDWRTRGVEVLTIEPDEPGA